MKIGDRLVFELIDGSSNARRLYVLSIIPDPQLPLYGEDGCGVVLVAGFGRDRVTHAFQWRFPSLALLGRKWEALVRTRARHGYRRIVPK